MSECLRLIEQSKPLREVQRELRNRLARIRACAIARGDTREPSGIELLRITRILLVVAHRRRGIRMIVRILERLISTEWLQITKLELMSLKRCLDQANSPADEALT